ncbi:MAG: ACP S-malonyltransferase [Rhodobacteraceae bacterium]|nr:ACP S-malonyltransferase [Paracoccaceae bacterium]
MTRQTALVVAPGRGTYNKEELGYLHRHHAGQGALLAKFDALRLAAGQPSITTLDGADRYTVSCYSRGDNASALIHACAVADFAAIDRERFDIVAVTGNSMGWYIALACGGALDPADGFQVVNTMGTLMQAALIGGQMLYPFVDEDWREIPGRRGEIMDLIARIEGLYLSIELGGMLVLAGEEPALAEAEKHLPQAQGRFPMRLANHAAFHSPLQAPVSDQGRAALPASLFAGPKIPLIDGRGHIWWPHTTDPAALWTYTLGHQVVMPYDFTGAMRTGLREFAPDVVIILGPGRTLGGAVAQSLIACDWQGSTSRADFQTRNLDAPLVLLMGLDAQRSCATGN